MTNYQKRQKKKKRNGTYRKWHRRLGFAASLFLFNLAITGIFLNHDEVFNWQDSYVSSDWLLDWYGVKAPNDPKCYQVETQQICQLDNLLFLDGNYWQKESAPLLGVYKLTTGLTLVTSQKINFFTPQGQLIDEISVQETLEKNLLSSHLSEGKLIIKTSNANYTLDEEFLEWTQLLDEANQANETSQNTKLITTIEQQALTAMQQIYRQRQITHLKLLQDLHSGRIINMPGKLLNDIAAIILILLAISGFITWQKRLGKKRED